jgi:vanillate O-demethylase ferredoxin subunit
MTALTVRILAKTAEAEDVFSFELGSGDGSPLPEFSAGAHVDVHIGSGLVRQYSLCNDPQERHRYVIGVLRDAGSRGGSIALHEQLQAGDEIRISAPRNLFPLVPARRSILFAGGIGITPILCMAERLAATGSEFELHYCCRSAGRAAFRERIAGSPFAARTHFHYDDGGAAQQLKVPELLAEPDDATHLYVCGPGGFIEHVVNGAKAHGWQPQNIHLEYFGARPGDAASDGSFEVRIASSGRVIPVAADVTVAEALARAGIRIPLSCEQGVCGTCMTRVLEGEPDHRDLFMSEAEHALNDQFTPCCSRAKCKTLVLDL